MKVSVKKSVGQGAVDCLIVPVFEGERNVPVTVAGTEIKKQIKTVLSREKWVGKEKQTLLLPCASGKIRSVLLAGFGKKKGLDDNRVRQVAGTLVSAIKKSHSLRPVLDHGGRIPAAPFVEAVILANYQYTGKLSRNGNGKALREVTVIASDDTAAVRSGVNMAALAAGSSNWARDISNRPANEMTPTIMAGEARRMAKETGCKCTVLNESQMKKLKMGSLLAVARGSREPAKLIVVEYKHPKAKKKVALVGKGLTFDAGGISIKRADGMQKMKYDMCGGAAVLGAVRAIALQKQKAHVLAVVPATENMPGGDAYKPGDVIKASNGKTIEIVSTDAEGRLILADALVYTARKLKPDVMVDICTLTGGVLNALGREYTAVMGPSNRVVNSLMKAGEQTHERLWRLPHCNDYKGLLRSRCADMLNGCNEGAQTIIGGIFLSNFTEGVEWAHIDIAATSNDVKSVSYWDKELATGIGVRLFTQWIANGG